MKRIFLPGILLLGSCGYTKIARIEADPVHYRAREVHIQGMVTKSAGA